MNKLRLLFLLILISVYTGIYSQGTLIYNNDYTSAGSFLGTNTTGTLQLASGQLEYSGFKSGQDYRYQDQLSTVLDSNDEWRAEFEFELDQNSPSQDYGAILFALSSNTNHFQTSSGSSVSVWFGDVIGGNNDTYIFFRAESGGTFHTPSTKIYLDVSTSSVSNKYYARIERKGKHEFVMAIYNDLQRTDLLKQVCYSSDPTIGTVGDLEYLQHAVSTSASSTRYVNGYIDNMEIYDLSIECCDCDINAEFEIDDPAACPIEFTDYTTSCNTTYHMGSVFNFGDDKFEFLSSPNASGSGSNGVSHGYISPYVGTTVSPIMTAMAYHYNPVTDSYECCTDADTISFVPEAECENYNEYKPSIVSGNDCPPAGLDSLIVDDYELTVKTSNWNSYFNFVGAVIDFGDGHVEHLAESNTSYVYTYSSYDTYTVCVTVFGFDFNQDDEVICCSDEECYTVEIRDRSGDMKPGKLRIGNWGDAQSKFKVYPNPFANQFTVTYEADTEFIIVLNTIGEEVQRMRVTNDLKTNIDLSGQPDGIYFVRKVSGEQSETLKIVKQ